MGVHATGVYGTTRQGHRTLQYTQLLYISVLEYRYRYFTDNIFGLREIYAATSYNVLVMIP